MNFHISNLAPLRPQFSSSSLGASRSQPSSLHPVPGHGAARNHHSAGSGPVRIAVEPAEEKSSTADTDDDDDEDNDTDSSSDTAADEVTQDSRDVLAQRLTDLADRLGAANVRASCIEALHKQVDAMERVLRGTSSDRRKGSTSSSSSRQRLGPSLQPGARPRSLQLPTGQSSSGGGGGSGSGGESLGPVINTASSPMGSSWLMSHFQRRPSVHLHPEEGGKEAVQPMHKGDGSQTLALGRQLDTTSPSVEIVHASAQRPSALDRLASFHDASGPAPRISSQVAEDAIKEAEKLCAEMATVIESLQTRREESAHLQTVLVEREAVAHQRIQHAALVAGELQDVVADNEAELRHLRLELRAIEVQSMGYVPQDADPALEQSIRNWKDDWRALREKCALRRGSSFVLGDDSSTVFSALASPISQR